MMADPTPIVRLTVGRLRELLRDLPDEMPVSTEGCDCVGPSGGIEVWQGRLIINRHADLGGGEDMVFRS